MCIRWLKSCSRDISSITHKVLDSVFYSSCLHFYRLNPYLVHLVLGYKFFLRHLFLMIQLDSFSRFHSIFFHSCSCSKTIQKKMIRFQGLTVTVLKCVAVTRALQLPVLCSSNAYIAHIRTLILFAL